MVISRGFYSGNGQGIYRPTYALFRKWTEEGVYFVTRLKKNADYRVVEDRVLPKKRRILKDEVVEFSGHTARKNYPYQLRRIEVWDEENKQVIVLLTNHHEFGSTTIASIYKDRWQIEIFFKTIKQNLKIKTFVGTSANALMIQIWTA
ncbi:MAG: IS4 family transposase [Nitrospirota bacterium]|nr:IS4 family transposase [Nitrospirota bacterium]